jgi:hypothetical protein
MVACVCLEKPSAHGRGASMTDVGDIDMGFSRVRVERIIPWFYISRVRSIQWFYVSRVKTVRYREPSDAFTLSVSEIGFRSLDPHPRNLSTSRRFLTCRPFH